AQAARFGKFARACRAVGGAALAIVVGFALLAFSELWVGSATLPRWLPPPPYWVGRTLHGLPFAKSAPWKLVRYKLVGVSLQATALPPWSDAHTPAQAALSAGSYLGWSSATGGSLTLYGHACTPADPLAALTLRGTSENVEFTGAALVTADADPGIGYSLPTTRLTGPLPMGDLGSTALARCRSGAEALHQLGAVRVAEAPANPANLQVHLSTWPAAGVYAELVVVNPGPASLVVTGVEYAPAQAATGRVRVRRPASTAVTTRWRGGSGPAVQPPALSGTPSAAQVNEFQRAKRALVTSGNLPVDNADELSIVLRSSEAALIVIDQDSFHPTRPQLPAFFYPVVSYESPSGAGAALVSDRFAVGWTWQ
ncbi:MAG TPA: hypothetical protein PLT07_02775, partial [Trueperaceae bacterium]|nr:hypothetical protein [Trueperaceae bacterium]